MPGLTKKIDEEYAALLATEFPPSLQMQAGQPPYCAELKNRVTVDRLFYVVVQSAIAIFAIGIVTALIICIVRLVSGIGVGEIVGAIGSVVSGAATSWLQKYANELNKRWNASLALLERSGCA